MRKFVLTAALGLFTVSGAFANLLTNGDFEIGDFTGWTSVSPFCQGVASDAGGPPDFGCSPPNGLPAPGAHFSNYAAWLGSPFDEITGDPLGVLSQSVATNPLLKYTVDFWLANTEDAGVFKPNSLNVLWNGASIFSLTDASSFGYTHITVSNLIATGANTTLEFDSAHGPAYFVLDDVNVSAATPEPASMTLLGSALAGLGIAIRRRKTA